MYETGIDIIEISRIEKSIENPVFIEKYFHPVEITYSKHSTQAAQHFAVRFAAKEAVRKVLLSYINNLSWKDSWIENDKSGKPYLHFSEEVHKKIKIKYSSVSLSHTNQIAIAIVIIDIV